MSIEKSNETAMHDADVKSLHEEKVEDSWQKTRERWCRKSVVGFWLMGLINNFVFIVMNAGASSISGGAVGLVYVSNIAPALLVNGSLPFWFHLVSHKRRIVLVAFINLACLALVGLSDLLGVELVGVLLGATAAYLGQATVLPYASHFGSGNDQIMAWSSGSGFAGIAGYTYMLVLEDSGLSFNQLVLLALALPTFWLSVYYSMIASPDEVFHDRDIEKQEVDSTQSTPQEEGEGDIVKEECRKESSVTLSTKVCFLFTRLWPYMLPRFLLYWSGFTMLSGVWTSLGEPITSTSSRTLYLDYLSWMFWVGVFIARSSGPFFRLQRWHLWLLAAGQTGLLAFFSIDALRHFWLNLGLLFPGLLAGLLSGTMYTHGYLLVSREIEPEWKEFSLTAISLADIFGMLFADISGTFVQGCLFAANNLVNCYEDGTYCSAPVFQCGHTFNTTYNEAFL